VIDVAGAREIVVDGAAIGPELAVDHPVEYDAWDLESWTRRSGSPLPVRPEVTVDDRGPLVGRITATWRFAPSTLAVTYELRAGERELRLAVDLDWQHDEHLLSMAFPFDVRAATAACDVQFGVVHRPTHDSSPWDAARFEVCAHRYVSVAEPSFGVAVLNDGRYGHGLFDGAVRVSLARAARYPDPDADRGRHTVTLAVRPHDGDLAEVRAAATRLDRPPRVIAAGSGPVATPLVSVEAAGAPPGAVEVDAVKAADDGSGDVIVRFHEAVGDRRRVTVRAAGRIGAASRCDLLEEPERAEEVGDGIVALVLRPFELVTLRLGLVDVFDGR
jgi:alpha-mannosidase